MMRKMCRTKGLQWESQTGNPKNIAEIYQNIRTLVGIFLLYSGGSLSSVPSKVLLMLRVWGDPGLCHSMSSGFHLLPLVMV